jgi:hypothetical protein
LPAPHYFAAARFAETVRAYHRASGLAVDGSHPEGGSVQLGRPSLLPGYRHRRALVSRDSVNPSNRVPSCPTRGVADDAQHALDHQFVLALADLLADLLADPASRASGVGGGAKADFFLPVISLCAQPPRLGRLSEK